ncbi:hypothetical protein DAPPUDRAFT_59197 [Daphnia pulex]|uniref:Peroxisomal biogenesis factor 3 n=1 Tax=Daphnia pulex TaxID=6669 RepID=E9H7R8_DAPPU|nr:hypothetical protein DAPPUDRAFT_59197 [Daphnia pulex]|eukprot:EFX72227.1 hypothetical protein DAPPUDRAFT_59197 [Daphnia pulex]
MFSKLRSFGVRHHRKFIVFGALVGGGVLLKRYAEKKLIEWQETEMNQLLERSRKQQHFESTERTCNMTITSVLPQIQLAIGRSLDSDSITLLLKQKAPNKKDLWEQLKVIAFSRVISYVYGNAILAILLRAQVNILGAYLYLANQNPSKPDLELSPEAQSQFLSASNYWLSTGIEQFCLMVEKVVSSQVANLSLKQRLTLIELEQIFHDIRVALEDELSRQPNGFLANVMLPPQHSSGEAAPASPTLTKMMSETREVLESLEVSQLLSSCVNIGVVCVLDKFSEIVSALHTDTNQPDSQDFLHPNHISVYVAKLIPALNNFIFQDVWLTQLLAIEPLRVFGANIYESFSTL